MKTAVLAAILCAVITSSAPMASAFQAPASSSEDLNAEAIKAYQAKDYARFLEYAKRALALEPDSPRLIYNVACGEALRGNAAEAVRLLDRLLTRKLDLGAEGDDDFTSIRKTPEWNGFVSRLAELRKPLVRSHVAFKLADPNLVAAGIAVDTRTGDVYIASVRERKILRRTKKGVVSDFIHEAQDGFLSGASLAVDPARKLLYASTSAAPFMAGYGKEDFRHSGVFAFDLKSGRLVHKAMLFADGKVHFLNALALDGDGNVYVSDSAAAGIYCMRPGADTLESFLPASGFRSTQGLAFSDDFKTLYVADYTDGLWAVDMASKARRRVEAPADAWLAGMDGLTRVKDGFITVQIGVQPNRVLRLRLDAHKQRIATVEVLEMSHPDYSGPIQGDLDGGSFFYVANSQLNLANGETGAFAADRAVPTVILRLPL
jgi:sugar lactone lactonase YvrE